MSIVSDARFWDRSSRKCAKGAIADQARQRNLTGAAIQRSTERAGLPKALLG